ncbi:helix-turn-helix domain-containing protein [Devosia ginsengisoli]|uniref:helix-turn-helix domain-containing protein n=1 Tax=Devosia ginsengisoli TaxID=400770 RepID=UPI0026F1027A|nr:helix-turn-helix domain-containing protein [Devosia ginsengisoli]
MTTVVLPRLVSRMEEKGYTARSLAIAADLGATYVHDLIIGKKKGMRRPALEQIAALLDCSADYLEGRADDPAALPSSMGMQKPSYLSSGNGNALLPICDTIRQGIWREAGVQAAPPGAVAAVLTGQYPPAILRAYRIDDDHSAGLGLPMGTIITVLVEPDRELAEGDVVLFERTIEGRVFELSIRELKAGTLISKALKSPPQAVALADGKVIGRVISASRVLG